MDNHLKDYCASIDALDTAGELVLILDEAELSAQILVNSLACLGNDIILAEVDVIIVL